jgi:hypothetical protein
VSQDVNVTSAARVNNHLEVVLRRQVNTGDKEDYIFENKTQNFIWAISRDPVKMDGRTPKFVGHLLQGSFSLNVFQDFKNGTSDQAKKQISGGNLRSIFANFQTLAFCILWICFSAFF